MAAKRAGMPKLRVHDLRHTFASHWVLDGGDIFRLSNVTPFCDACAHRLAAAAMQLGEREHARRDRVGAEQPQSERQSVGEGRELFRRLYGGRDAVEFLAALYACGLGWRAAPAQAG